MMGCIEEGGRALVESFVSSFRRKCSSFLYRVARGIVS